MRVRMSSFKRDSYYEAHIDRDCVDPDYRESSDEDSMIVDRRPANAQFHVGSARAEGIAICAGGLM